MKYHVYNVSIPCFMGTTEGETYVEAEELFHEANPGHESARIILIPHDEMLEAVEAATDE